MSLFKNNMVRTGKKLFVLGLLSTTVFFTSCKENDPDDQPKPNTNIPTQYSYENVNYKGQTVRLLLLKDMLVKLNEASTKQVTTAELLDIYENTSARYADISTGKKLSDKIASPAADAQLRTWFDSLAVKSGSNNPYVLSSGIHLKEVIEKQIMGSVIYYRAVNDYLLKIGTLDNNTVKAGEGTTMQHAWDEALGYFGAARDYNNYTDAQIINPGEKDSDGNGTINPNSEKNMFFAQTAAKRDVSTASLSGTDKTDFTKIIFDAFLKGRYAIDNKDYAARDEAQQTILTNWEKVIAASVIHYVNDTRENIQNNDIAARNTHWSEIKSYFDIIPYNPSAKISTSNIEAVRNLLGNDVKDLTIEKLDQVENIIKTTYGFTDAQVNAW
ncbi:MAG: DUF4856 domain-containing protein [Bacteroidia bacterium]